MSGLRDRPSSRKKDGWKRFHRPQDTMNTKELVDMSVHCGTGPENRTVPHVEGAWIASTVLSQFEPAGSHISGSLGTYGSYELT